MHNMKRKIAFFLAGLMVASTISVPVNTSVKASEPAVVENVNLIPNGNFDEVSDCWGGFAQDGGEATFSQENGALVCNVDKVGTLPWSVQASCSSGFALYQNGKYRLSFDISSSVTRNITYGIQLNSGDYRSYVSKGITVTDEVQTVTVDFTMKEATDLVPALFFSLGMANEEDLDPHTVTIDNVDLQLVDASGIEGNEGNKGPQKEGVNLLPNGTFDTEDDNWGGFAQEGGEATIAQKDGALVVDIDKVGDVSWAVQANCASGFELYQNGKYRLTFDINSTIARELAYGIQMNGGDYTAYVSDNITVNEETQTVSVDFTMTKDTDKAPALFFNLGNYGEDLDPHTITIDNASLVLLDGSGIATGVNKQEEGVNLMPNGTFDEVSPNWGSFTTDGGKAVIEQKDGALVCDIAKVGTLNYSVQASCGSGFQLYQNGKYTLSFDISSTLARKLEYGIQMNGGDYRAYVSEKIAINEDVQRVTIDFTMTDETDMAPAFFLNMGIYDDEDLDPHTVVIDNVELILTDGSEIVYEEKEEFEQPINVNQVGYLPDAKKIAVFRGTDLAGTYKVVNAEDETVVFEGELSDGRYNETADETDFYGDFTDVTTPGTYYIELEGLGKSYPFTIGEGVYDNTFKDAFRFFYLQRCGGELDADVAGAFAHPECHTSLARIYGTEDYIDVSGGWHDAGDYGRYVVATSKAVADLLIGYDANKGAFSDELNIPESGNGQSDMLDEIRGQIQWLMKMQNKENGGVYHKVTCANFPGSIAADKETAELIVCPITTTATGDFAAIMGMAYDAFKKTDKEFADACLAAGEKAYDYLVAQPSTTVSNPEGIVTGEYGDYSDKDERYFAAASLFKATGKEKYNEAVKAAVRNKIKLGYGWQDMGSYAVNLYLSAKNADEETVEILKDLVLGKADELVEVAKEEGYGISFTAGDYYWGSNMGVLNNAATLVDAYKISGDSYYLEVAKEHVNYVLGKNPMGTSYVTGSGTVSPEHTHHRPSIVYGESIKGALVGGPNKNLEDNYAKAYLAGKAPAKCYLDNQECYSTNEVDIYWTSTLVRSLAELKLVSAKEEFSDVAVKATVDSNVNNNIINQTYTIKADDETIDTSKVTLRYYLNNAGDQELKYNVDHAAINTSKAPWYQALTTAITSEIAEDEKGTYVELKVDEAVEIEPGDGVFTIMARINKTDWTDFATDVTGELVVYYDGKLVK